MDLSNNIAAVNVHSLAAGVVILVVLIAFFECTRGKWQRYDCRCRGTRAGCSGRSTSLGWPLPVILVGEGCKTRVGRIGTFARIVLAIR
jgi:hypothetical protein